MTRILWPKFMARDTPTSLTFMLWCKPANLRDTTQLAATNMPRNSVLPPAFFPAPRATNVPSSMDWPGHTFRPRPSRTNSHFLLPRLRPGIGIITRPLWPSLEWITCLICTARLRWDNRSRWAISNSYLLTKKTYLFNFQKIMELHTKNIICGI